MGRQRSALSFRSARHHGWEWRGYMRDPDGYLEVGRYTQMGLPRFKNDPS